MEAATPIADCLERHGVRLDLQSQFDRAAYGINPTTGAIGHSPSAATRFLSHRDQLNVINRVEHIYKTTAPWLAQDPILFKSIIGSGFQKRTLNYGTQYSGRVYLNQSGKAKTAFPLWQK